MSYVMKISPVGVELFHADGRTDRQMYMTEISVAVLNFANAPKHCVRGFFVQESPPALTLCFKGSQTSHLEMVLTETTRSNRVGTCDRATSSSSNLTRTDLGLHSDERTIFESCVPTAQSTQCISTGRKKS
jgi:hypothetical protein